MGPRAFSVGPFRRTGPARAAACENTRGLAAVEQSAIFDAEAIPWETLISFRGRGGRQKRHRHPFEEFDSTGLSKQLEDRLRE